MSEAVLSSSRQPREEKRASYWRAEEVDRDVALAGPRVACSGEAGEWALSGGRVFHSGFCVLFLGGFFGYEPFFIFKVFIGFVRILLLVYVLVFLATRPVTS